MPETDKYITWDHSVYMSQSASCDGTLMDSGTSSPDIIIWNQKTHVSRDPCLLKAACTIRMFEKKHRQFYEFSTQQNEINKDLRTDQNKSEFDWDAEARLWFCHDLTGRKALIVKKTILVHAKRYRHAKRFFLGRRLLGRPLAFCTTPSPSARTTNPACG